jgi:hypothetical protein
MVIGFEDMECTLLAQDNFQWCDFVNTVFIYATLTDWFYSGKYPELYAYIYIYKCTLIFVFKVLTYFKMFIINFENYKKQEPYTLSTAKVL